MKPKNLAAGDESLNRLLAEWRQDAPLPRHFQDRVWQSISRAAMSRTPSVGSQIAEWLDLLLARPAFAAPYVAALLMLGMSVGWVQSQHESARVRNELGDRYLQTLDPYQAAHR